MHPSPYEKTEVLYVGVGEVDIRSPNRRDFNFLGHGRDIEPFTGSLRSF